MNTINITKASFHSYNDIAFDASTEATKILGYKVRVIRDSRNNLSLIKQVVKPEGFTQQEYQSLTGFSGQGEFTTIIDGKVHYREVAGNMSMITGGMYTPYKPITEVWCPDNVGVVCDNIVQN